MIRIIFLTLIFSLLPSFAYGEEISLPSMDKFEKALKELVLNYYPEAAFTIEENRITFEYDTRTFLIHYPLKTGEWQEAAETKGPNKDGVLGVINLYEGRYEGAAMVPQTFNDRYFETLLLCPESSKYNCYFHIRLSYPYSLPEGFIREFTEVVNNFEQYMD